MNAVHALLSELYVLLLCIFWFSIAERVRLKISSQGALGVPMLGSKPKRNDPFADLHNPNSNPASVSVSPETLFLEYNFP